MKTKTLLVSAYGCEPGKGSEQGVGWNWVLQLAGLVELVVITRANNRRAIEEAMPKGVCKHIRFIYYDAPKFVGRFKRKERGFYLYYLIWQWGAYRLARREIKQNPVDYVMHLTFGSIWLPTFMHRLRLPFIWGPVGGGEAVPLSLVKTLPIRGRLLQYVRHVLIACLPFNPLFTGPARKATIIVARTEDTAKVIPKRYRAKTRIILETAAVADWFDQPQAQHSDIPTDSLQVIYTGRLVPFKNLQMAIRAVAIARARGMSIYFVIVGDGPLISGLTRIAEQEGIADAGSFVGRQTRSELFKFLSVSDLYLFPSLREGGPWSLMEAMAVGLPVVCVRTSGMSVIVDETCGRLIEPAPPAAMTKAFADALCDLAMSPDTRRRMGANARECMQSKFSWERKTVIMSEILDDIERG